jgi:hypothetical protein
MGKFGAFSQQALSNMALTVDKEISVDKVISVDIGTTNLAAVMYDLRRGRLAYVRLHNIAGTPAAMAVAVRDVFEALRSRVPAGDIVRCVLENQFCCGKFQFKVMKVAGMCMSEATRLFGEKSCSEYNSHTKFAFYGLDGGKTRMARKKAARAFVQRRFLINNPQDGLVMAEYSSAAKTDDMDDAIMMALHVARVTVSSS